MIVMSDRVFVLVGMFVYVTSAAFGALLAKKHG